MSIDGVPIHIGFLSPLLSVNPLNTQHFSDLVPSINAGMTSFSTLGQSTTVYRRIDRTTRVGEILQANNHAGKARRVNIRVSIGGTQGVRAWFDLRNFLFRSLHMYTHELGRPVQEVFEERAHIRCSRC
jgi:hypothetical protein